MNLATDEKTSSPTDKKETLSPQVPVTGAPGRRRRRWPMYIIAVVVALLLWRVLTPHASKTQGQGGRHGGGDMSHAPVPVVVGTTQARDFPVYLDGIGTVQAYFNVKVPVQVNGMLQTINFEEGKPVKKDDLLAQINPAPYKAAYDQAVARMAEDQALLNNAKLVLERDQELLSKQVIARQDFDTQRYTADQYQATVQADQAAIESAKVNLDWTRITAPVDGIAGIRMVDPGNIVQTTGTNSSLVVINQVQPIYVVFTLPQQQLRQVRNALVPGTPLKVFAMSRDNSIVLAEGTLTVLDNQIQQTTATVNLKATFPNTRYELWPGQFVNVRLLVDTKKNAVTVPAAAVQVGPDGSYVYEVTSEMKAQMVPVQVGGTEDGFTLITGGIDAGVQVVVDGQYRLQADSTVEISKGGPSADASPSPSGSPHHHRKKPQAQGEGGAGS